MIGDRAIAWLRTPIATLLVLVAALLAQLPHAADVFRLVVHGDGIWQVLHSYSYAVALELAVLLFVVQRRNVESYLFALVSVCVNLAYYALHGVNLFGVAALPAWLISIALPAAIARYSHLIVDAAHVAPAHVAHSNALEPAQDEAQQDGAQSAKPAQDGAQNQRRTERKTSATRRKSAQKMSATQRRLHIVEAGFTDASTVATQFGISLRTAQADLAAVRSGNGGYHNGNH